MARPAIPRAWQLILSSFSALLCACGGCEQDTLSDISCKTKLNDGCQCLDGEELTCGTDVGLCQPTTVICANGRFPNCVPRVAPNKEDCDGLDNDCNGVIDDIQPQECWTGPAEAVFRDPSICQPGYLECLDGLEVCQDQILPVEPEQCNGLDDNCNGLVDENPFGSVDPQTGERVRCGSMTGECRPGVLICVGWDLVCGSDPRVSTHYVGPQNEICNDKDDDCDGETDEGLFQRCGSQACPGIATCQAGNWVNCDARVPRPVDICNDGIDNDCDGQVDNANCVCEKGTVKNCTDGLPCGLGIQICNARGEWDPCQFLQEIDELCNGGRDDDCNPKTSEEGLTRDCGNANIGQCRTGTATCHNGVWDACEGEITPQPEICGDMVDNDCNGLTDENLYPRHKTDVLFIIDWSRSMCGFHTSLRAAIAAFVSEFAGTDHRFALAKVPGEGPGQAVTLVTAGLVEAIDFQTALTNLSCDGGGLEPVPDALFQLTAPNSAVGWRADAFPYLFVFADEDPRQSFTPDWAALTNTIIAQTTTCVLPGCEPPGCQLPTCQPGPPEVYVFTRLVWDFYYQQIVNNTTHLVPQRIFELDPPNANRYKSNLDSAISDLCRNTVN